ncbi:hypothetical protein [Streptomyces sp. NBC_01235]|nr:hypothetical protein OG289_00575 [Streptomyces sp. NBC_01235]
MHCSHAERLEQLVDSVARNGPVTTSLVLRSYPQVAANSTGDNVMTRNI